MSYAITGCKVLHLDAYISKQDFNNLYMEYENEIPEDNFLDDLKGKKADENGLIKLERFSWTGSYSGHSYSKSLPKIVEKIKGDIEVMFTWEHGDSFTGMMIHDGVITECEVKQILVPIVK
jgi:hypothetical protein